MNITFDHDHKALITEHACVLLTQEQWDACDYDMKFGSMQLPFAIVANLVLQQKNFCEKVPTSLGT